jgi:Glycosyl hydrolases family 18
MSTETMVVYWIGEEPTPPSPTLNQMPAYVDVVPLAFVTIGQNYQLNFDFLCKQNSASTIKGWIEEVRANGTKVLLSINDQKLGNVPNIPLFVDNVVRNAVEWGVDGVDLDYEPPSRSPGLLRITSMLRPILSQRLGTEALITAPIYEPWIWIPDFLKSFAAELDFVTTMDYTGYPGFDETISLVEQYASIIGTPEKVAIGTSCMGPPPPASENFTPLDDVVKLCQWEPQGGRKKGAMLYTFSYDVTTRKGSGTGYPDGTFTKTIHENLP